MDDMNDLKIVVKTDLQIDTNESIKRLKQQVPQLNTSLKDVPLKVTAELDTSKVKTGMSNLVSELTGKSNIKPNVDTSEASQKLKELSKELIKIGNAAKNGSGKIVISSDLFSKEIKDAYEALDVTKFLNKIAGGRKGWTLSTVANGLTPTITTMEQFNDLLAKASIAEAKFGVTTEQTANTISATSEAVKSETTAIQNEIKAVQQKTQSLQETIKVEQDTANTTKKVTQATTAAADAANNMSTALNSVNTDAASKEINELYVKLQELRNSITASSGKITISNDILSQLMSQYNYDIDKVDAIIGKITGGNHNWRGVKSVDDATIKTFEQFQTLLQSVTTIEQQLVQETNKAAESVNNLGTAFNGATSKNPFVSTFKNTTDTLEKAKQAFSSLGTVDISHIFKADGNITKFTVNVKGAEHATESFTYALDEMGKAFEIVGGKGSDTGVQRLLNDISRAKSKFNTQLSDFQNTNGSMTGLTSQIESVRSAINSLGDGTTSFETQITTIQSLFASLKEAANTIQSNAKTTGKSFNPIINAINDIAQAESQIKKLENSFRELIFQPQKAAEQIQNLKTLLADVISTEKDMGRGVEWSEKYKAYNAELAKTKELLKTSQQEQKAGIFSDNITVKAKAYKDIMIQARDEWKAQGVLVGQTSKDLGNMINHIAQIKSQTKLDEYVNRFQTMTTDMARVKTNLDEQIASQNKIYEIRAKIVGLKETDTVTRAYYQEQLTAAEKTLENLQMQSNVYKNIIPLEEQEKILTEATATAREKMLVAQNRAVDSQTKKQTDDLRAYNNEIEKNVRNLQRLANNTTFSKNSSNPDVANQINQLNALSTAYENLKGKYAGKTDTASVTAFANELTVLRDRYNQVTAAVTTYQQKLKNSNAEDAQMGKNRALIAQLEAFANANQKAMKSTKTSSTGMTFTQEINEMLVALRAGADPTQYNKIVSNFRRVRAEIKGMGLEGGTVFQNLWKNIKKFGSWMGVTSVITRMVWKVREAITEIKNLDTILTEISKTSDRSAVSLKKLGDESFAVASKFGQKASDYLKGVQEMSRAGFNGTQAEDMAELSTLAQSAGDMTAELANEYLIATNAAYKFGGSAEKLTSVLNSQNLVTNKNALNMTELAEATKIAGSQAAQSGIEISKMTAAVGTMIATTQQGGDVAGRAFKGRRDCKITIAHYGSNSIAA